MVKVFSSYFRDFLQMMKKRIKQFWKKSNFLYPSVKNKLKKMLTKVVPYLFAFKTKSFSMEKEFFHGGPS